MVSSVTISGYQELLRACDKAGGSVRREVRAAFREVGEQVRVGAQQRFAPVDARSAAGYRVIVRQRGVAVEQVIPRTTGLHPEFGVLQMHEALIPSLEANEPVLERELDEALDKVAAIFAKG